MARRSFLFPRPPAEPCFCKQLAGLGKAVIVRNAASLPSRPEASDSLPPKKCTTRSTSPGASYRATLFVERLPRLRRHPRGAGDGVTMRHASIRCLILQNVQVGARDILIINHDHRHLKIPDSSELGKSEA